MKLQDILIKLKAFVSFSGFSDKKKNDLDHFLDNINEGFVFCIVGQTGSGKSTLINKLFKPIDKQKVNHGMATQSEPQNVKVKLDNNRGIITIIDMPGLCEDIDKKERIEKFYDDNLINTDIILWLHKVDNSALQCDQEYYNKLSTEIKNKIVFGISQLEKGGGGEWHNKDNKPSKAQLEGILNKIRTMGSKFNIPDEKLENKVVCFSANKNYNLDKLLYVLSIHSENSAKLALKLNPEIA